MYMYMYIYIYMYTCIYKYMYICMYIYMYLCMYMHMHTYIHTHIYIYMYVYTYTHAFKCRSHPPALFGTTGGPRHSCYPFSTTRPYSLKSRIPPPEIHKCVKRSFDSEAQREQV